VIWLWEISLLILIIPLRLCYQSSGHSVSGRSAKGAVVSGRREFFSFLITFMVFYIRKRTHYKSCCLLVCWRWSLTKQPPSSPCFSSPVHGTRRVRALCLSSDNWVTAAAVLHQVTRPSDPSPATGTHQVCASLLFHSCRAKPSTRTSLSYLSICIRIWYTVYTCLIVSILLAKIIECACVYACPLLGSDWCLKLYSWGSESGYSSFLKRISLEVQVGLLFYFLCLVSYCQYVWIV
jgi:hypothetical protein